MSDLSKTSYGQWHKEEPTKNGEYLCYVEHNGEIFGDSYTPDYCYEVCSFYNHDGTEEYGVKLAYKGWQTSAKILSWTDLPEEPKFDD